MLYPVEWEVLINKDKEFDEFVQKLIIIIRV